MRVRVRVRVRVKVRVCHLRVAVKVEAGEHDLARQPPARRRRRRRSAPRREREPSLGGGGEGHAEERGEAPGRCEGGGDLKRWHASAVACGGGDTTAPRADLRGSGSPCECLELPRTRWSSPRGPEGDRAAERWHHREGSLDTRRHVVSANVLAALRLLPSLFCIDTWWCTGSQPHSLKHKV